MTYRLSKLAAGNYDVLLSGVLIASLARTQTGDHVTWSAEPLVDLPPSERPEPFVDLGARVCEFRGSLLLAGRTANHLTAVGRQLSQEPSQSGSFHRLKNY